MGLLEKLRPQPKWKHADPVRPARRPPRHRRHRPGVARRAGDRRSGRARPPRGGGPGDRRRVLAAIVRNESDASVRDHAATRLAGLAEQGDERVALAAVSALAALGRQRELAAVARGSHLDSVRRAAVEQVTDQKALAAHCATVSRRRRRGSSRSAG